MHTSGSCLLDFSSVDVGTTSGIPNREARALRFSSSGSSTAVAAAGFVVEDVVGTDFGGGAGSWEPGSAKHSDGQRLIIPGLSWARRLDCGVA